MRTRHFIFQSLVFLFCFLIFQKTLHARPLTSQDQGFEILDYAEDQTYQADGKFKTHIKYHYKIITGKGTLALSVYRVSYNVNTQRVQILEASVKNGEEKIVVNPKDIEEKSLFGGISSYDETRTKIIPLPNLKIGTEVVIDYTFEEFRPPYPGVVSNRDRLIAPVEVKNLSYKVTYPDTVTLKVRDIKQVLTPHIKTEKKNGLNVWSVEMKNFPAIGFTLESDGFVNRKNLIWIDVSNLKSFEEAAAKASIGYEKVLAKPVPEKLKVLFGEKPTNPLDREGALKRMAEILRKISDNFRYFGDWRSVDGGYVPRDLQVIADSGYGDCKDFAVLVAAAARYLGLEADTALVYRDVDPSEDPTIPTLGIYNHAIARITVPGSTPDHIKDWWVDATNPIPNIGLIPPDIADRHTLILGRTLKAVHIPRDDEGHNAVTVDLTLDPKAAPDYLYHAKIQLEGHWAWNVMRDLFAKSPKQTEEYIVGLVAVSPTDAKNFKLLSSENNKDYPYTQVYEFDVTEKDGVKRSGDLKVLSFLTYSDAPGLITEVDPETRVSDLYLGNLKHVLVKERLKEDSYEELLGAPRSCDIKSPWLEYKRDVTTDPTLLIVDDFKIRKYRIENDELKSEAFSKLQKDLRDCLRGFFIVVK